MHTKGYIKMPRSINTLPLTSRVMMMHLCSECQYCDAEHPVVGTLHVGEIVTSRNALSTLLDLSVQEVRTALTWLEGNDYIKVESTARYTKITVLWQDFLALNGLEIMLNNQASNHVSNQAPNQVSISTSAENTSGCEDEKILPTMSATKRLTKSVTNNNIKYIENTITHTSNSKYLVETKNAPARETHAHTSDTHEQVKELELYIAQKCSDYFIMEQPFTSEELHTLTDKYPMADIQTILLEGWSNGACDKKKSAMAVFTAFARGYYRFRPQPAPPTERERLYTYEEKCDEITMRGIPDKAFEMVVLNNGQKLWRRIKQAN